MKIPANFKVETYGKLEQITPTISKCRVRIFYKYMNRNRTYITEDFANEMISSLPYTPVKGIFDNDEIDFEDHGKKNSDGKIYGVVPENPNFAWEDHMDLDGVMRTYACADVYLFTGLYPEAKLVPDKSQSMEIFADNLVGKWKIADDGEPYYLFEHGCFVGLQILGDETEPCFEGAAFYNLQEQFNELKEVLSYLKKELKNNGEVEKEMDKTLFRLSDNEKLDKIEYLLNPNFCEEGGWVQDRVVMEVYEDYALCYNITNNIYERAYYSRENDSITIGDICTVYIVDVTADEQMALEAIKSARGTYEAAKESLEEEETLKNSLAEKETAFSTEKAALEEKVSALEGSVSEYEKTKTETEEKINEFTQKIQELEAEKVEFEQKVSDITSENESLVAFKKQTELAQKEDILSKYEEHLTEEIFAQLKEKIDSFSVVDFKKEVCTAAVENSPSIFDNKDSDNGLIYKGEGKSEPMSGVERLLEKYKRNGGSK